MGEYDPIISPFALRLVKPKEHISHAIMISRWYSFHGIHLSPEIRGKEIFF
jgi:hypothetical protein